MKNPKDRWLTTVAASMIVLASFNLELVIKVDSEAAKPSFRSRGAIDYL